MSETLLMAVRHHLQAGLSEAETVVVDAHDQRVVLELDDGTVLSFDAQELVAAASE